MKNPNKAAAMLLFSLAGNAETNGEFSDKGLPENCRRLFFEMEKSEIVDAI